MDRVNKRIFIQRINNLPTLPGVITKIIELSDAKGGNADSLGEVLAKDPSISSTILKLVNSAFYGNLRHISSIKHATVILGFQMVKTIAMGVSIYQSKKGSSGFDREQFWLHSLGVATFAQKIAAVIETPPDLTKDSVFLAGLLHDVGKVIFDNYFEEEYAEVMKIVAEEQIWIGGAEHRVMGMNHCEAGFYLGRKWQFPNAVVEAIRYHHNMSKCSKQNRVLCAIVHTADHCCRKIGLGSGGDPGSIPLDPMVKFHGITPQVISRVIEEVEEIRGSLEGFLTEIA